MNKTQIAVSLLSGKVTNNEQMQKEMIKDAFIMADKILRFDSHKNTSTNSIDDLLKHKLRFDALDSDWRWLQASALLKECGVVNPDKYLSSIAGNFLRNHGCPSRKSSGKKLFFCPPTK